MEYLVVPDSRQIIFLLVKNDFECSILEHFYTMLKMFFKDDEGSHDRFAHYIKKDKVVESAVTGKAVRALCGKKWVPSRDPEKYPICPACKAIYDTLVRKKESE